MLTMETLQKIGTQLGSERNQLIPYYSEAEFSMHELLEALLKVTGPAYVKLTTFSITEAAIRTFHQLSDEKLILGLHCIFDISVRMHRLGLLNFALNVSGNIALTKNHAKIILIENENYKLTVISSANLNVNDKIEAGIITTQTEIFYFYFKKFWETYNKSVIIDQNEFNS